MLHRRARPLLLALALGAALPALARSPAPAAPQVPTQVSNVAWAGDMAQFASQDAANPPPRGGIEFIGSSSIDPTRDQPSLFFPPKSSGLLSPPRPSLNRMFNSLQRLSRRATCAGRSFTCGESSHCGREATSS